MNGNLLMIIILILLGSIVIYYYYSISCEDNQHNSDLDISYLGKEDLTIVDIIGMRKNNRHPFITRINQTTNLPQTISYQEYWNRSNLFAERLLRTIGPNARVLLLCYSQIEWYIAFMGTLIANGIVVIADPGNTIEQMNKIINHSKCDIVIVGDSDYLNGMDTDQLGLVITINHIPNISKKIQSSDVISYENFLSGKYNDNLLNGMDQTIAFGKVYPEKIALIVYTNNNSIDQSLKGVQLTHRNIICSIKNSLFLVTSRSLITITSNERFLSIYPQNAISAVMMSFAIPLAVSGHVYLYDKSIDILDVIKRIEPTILIASKDFWGKLLNGIKERMTDPNGIINQMFINRLMIGKFGMNHIKYAINLGCAMIDSDRKYFKDIGIDVCDAYGFAETCGAISLSVPGCNKGVGIPLLDIMIDPITSEIKVRGDQVFRGYYMKKKLYKKNDWFSLGKKGYIDRDGSLNII